jgi:hypothetical protein
MLLRLLPIPAGDGPCPPPHRSKVSELNSSNTNNLPLFPKNAMLNSVEVSNSRFEYLMNLSDLNPVNGPLSCQIDLMVTLIFLQSKVLEYGPPHK